ncbi:histidinol-phosphate transaminase [Actinomyces capricornis]|uniref:Histidinol-phosphate aminotransferase n=1 Tax=Actinomyces capricornis TaxID=2755559 RepID=A0ABM7UAI1_9ACTO|nr:histidinol-phosphate transaminase [Actinomyces capricornis]BDA64340.1 putative phenylalanine aminotransferase [Actinomyces capricornis]
MSTVSARSAANPAGPAEPGSAVGPVRPTTTVRIRPDLADLPAYVPGARAPGAQAVKLSSNELPYPPQEPVVQAIARAGREVNRYPQMTGAGLVAALAEHWGISPDQVVVGNGSVALIQHLLDTVCQPGDEVVLPWRSFEAYPICVAVAGATAVRVPLDAQARHDIPAMLAAITPRTRMVIACSPNNPTGTVLSATDLADLVAGVPQDVVVLVDEAYLDFVTDPGAGRALPLLDSHPNLVIARTFSKAHALAGLRVGCLIAEPGLASAVRSVCTPFGVSLPAQAAALAALGEEVQAETARRCRDIAVERDRLAGVLRDQGWQVPTAQGNFLWLPVGREASAVAEHFAQAGLLVRPFAGEGVRVSVGLPADNERVAAAAAAWMGAAGSSSGA